MDRVTDPPPERVAADLSALRSALDAAVPAKMLDRNLVIATWRWEMFDAVTEKWVGERDDRPRRDLRAIRCMTEIVQHFDVVALQGLLRDARGLQLVMEALGDDWALMVTGLSRESSYNERTAFIFDTRKVLPRGLAGQVVLPASGEKEPAAGDFLSRQFFRPPLFAGFRCLDQAFTVANIHLVFGKPAERVAEMRAFVSWLREVSERGYYWERNFIVLGQLQLMRSGTPLHEALFQGGLRIPDDLVDVPTFVGSAGTPVSMASSIAWFGTGSGPAELELEYLRGGVFNFLSEDLPFRDRPFEGYLSSTYRCGQSSACGRDAGGGDRMADPRACPRTVSNDLVALAAALDEAVPAKSLDRNLLIATWNIRNFGAYNPKWVADPADKPKRDLQSIHSIAEIISRFDVVAIQEVKSDTSALRAVYELLGERWSVMLTDVTAGALGNAERMAFLFDTRRVQLSGLACEIVIPPEHLEQTEADALQRQFARTPYAVGFRTAGHTITLVALHVIWGDSQQERLRELTAIARWLAAWSRDKHAWDHNLITLGDFNIDRGDGPYHAALTSTGLHIPSDLRTVQRSIFVNARQPAAAYDQIAWFEGARWARPLSLIYSRGGSFDFTTTAMSSRSMTLNQLSWCLSDHLPLWVEFEVPR